MDIANAQQLVGNILQKLGVEHEGIEAVRHMIDHHRTVLMIRTKDPSVLIGPQGETLHALNHIIRQMVRKQSSDPLSSGILIDVNHYREGQIEEILYRAKVIADRARLFKRDVEFPPASSYERMIVHSYFSNDPSFTTESRGEGRSRHVVVKYAEEKVQPV